MLTVGAILKEPVSTVVRFVEWYAAQGAGCIVLCFDDPEDPAIEVVSGREDVIAIRATAEFWEGLGTTADERFTKRQNLAMGHVYRNIPEGGWFLNVDSDELLFLEERTIAQEVARQPASCRALRFLPAEHIQSPDDPDRLYFRLPQKGWVQRSIYGDLAQAVKPRHGLMGHTVGKSVTRTGLSPVKVRQHWIEDQDGPIEGATLSADEGAYLFHFVDQGYEVWRNKIRWRLSSRGFRLPMRLEIEARMDGPEPEAALRDLYDCLHVFNEERLAQMERGGALRSWTRAELGLTDPDWPPSH